MRCYDPDVRLPIFRSNLMLEIVEPHTGGDPMSSRKWLNCRLRDIRERLVAQEHGVSVPVISRLLKCHGYSLKGSRKELEGAPHPERNQQFEHIYAQRAAHQARGQPCISVDTKKKELIGDFKNAGRIWCQEAEQVNVHDFRSQAVGRVVPYGIYDRRYNCGTVYVGQSADTPTFAVDNVVRWCQTRRWKRWLSRSTRCALNGAIPFLRALPRK